LIWLLQQRLRAVSWPHWRLRCMLQTHCTATAWELSGLDHSHAATPQRVTRASCAQLLLLRSDFCAWRRLPLICLKLLIGVCVRDGLAASVCVYIALLLLPLSFVLGVGAPSLSLVGFISHRISAWGPAPWPIREKTVRLTFFFAAFSKTGQFIPL